MQRVPPARPTTPKQDARKVAASVKRTNSKNSGQSAEKASDSSAKNAKLDGSSRKKRISLPQATMNFYNKVIEKFSKRQIRNKGKDQPKGDGTKVAATPTTPPSKSPAAGPSGSAETSKRKVKNGKGAALKNMLKFRRPGSDEKVKKDDKNVLNQEVKPTNLPQNQAGPQIQPEGQCVQLDSNHPNDERKLIQNLKSPDQPNYIKNEAQKPKLQEMTDENCDNKTQSGSLEEWHMHMGVPDLNPDAQTVFEKVNAPMRPAQEPMKQGAHKFLTAELIRDDKPKIEATNEAIPVPEVAVVPVQIEPAVLAEAATGGDPEAKAPESKYFYVVGP